MLYSAGECPVCSTAGDALFVKDRLSGRVFFLCPSCGCAWPNPPVPHRVDTVDSPARFAPDGVDVPSKAEIAAMGLEEAIAREIDDSEWMESLQGFLASTGASESRAAGLG
jgi:hypothetical protein